MYFPLRNFPNFSTMGSLGYGIVIVSDSSALWHWVKFWNVQLYSMKGKKVGGSCSIERAQNQRMASGSGFKKP